MITTAIQRIVAMIGFTEARREQRILRSINKDIDKREAEKRKMSWEEEDECL